MDPLTLILLGVLVIVIIIVIVNANSKKRREATGQTGMSTVSARPLPSGKTNALAIVAFVLSFFISIPAIVLGHVALSQIKRNGDAGRGLAEASLWIGYLSVAASIVLVFVVLLHHN